MSQIFSESRHEMPNHFRGSQEFSRHRVLREERMVSRTIFPVHGEKPSVMPFFSPRTPHCIVCDTCNCILWFNFNRLIVDFFCFSNCLHREVELKQEVHRGGCQKLKRIYILFLGNRISPLFFERTPLPPVPLEGPLEFRFLPRTGAWGWQI